MRPLEIVTFTLPVHWAPLLINGDDSHMSADELAAFNEWMEDLPPDAHCLDMGEDYAFMRYHDASTLVLPCDVASFTFLA